MANSRPLGALMADLRGEALCADMAALFERVSTGTPVQIDG
ncbi:MAG: hypothetical protein OD918_07005 [Gammaproteobacteria bacterium]